jgi:hypothetical protein
VVTKKEVMALLPRGQKPLLRLGVELDSETTVILLSGYQEG